MAAVDSCLREHLSSEVALVSQVSEYIISSGGKRLRPALLLLAARACDYRGPHAPVLAAVVELIHTATLLHDDVVDESALRRGRATANAMFGNAASVLVGDFLYSRSFQMMVTVDNMRILRILSDATNVIAEGEVLQLLNCGNADLDESRYLEVIRRKTAKLFEAAMRIGGVLGGAGAATEEALANYGVHVGTAFQLIDDVLDYSGEHADIGKNLGDDLAEGKATLPLIRAMQVAKPEDAALLRRAIVEARIDEFGPVMEIIRGTDAIAYARACAGEEAQLASAQLAHLGSSKYRDALLELALFAVERTH
jgi:octaprenyl-diphosphate synthase